jgi:hypothetical protein
MSGVCMVYKNWFRRIRTPVKANAYLNAKLMVYSYMQSIGSMGQLASTCCMRCSFMYLQCIPSCAISNPLQLARHIMFVTKSISRQTLYLNNTVAHACYFQQFGILTTAYGL